MSRERIGSLIHNARNRLSAVIDRLDGLPEGGPAVAELQRVASQLTSAMALLRLDEPGEGIRRHEVDLELFFSDLKAEVARLAPPHLRTACTSDFSACLFPCWTFDSHLVRLVIIDALMNAWRHAREKVELEAAFQAGELYFVVRDDGPGFPPAWLAEPLPADAPMPHGTGQGLRLAGRIAQLHAEGGRRGQIGLSNEGIGGGAAFRLILP